MTIGNEAEDFISLVEKTKVEAKRVGLTPSFGSAMVNENWSHGNDRQSLVCLRRQLVNVVWMMLKHKTEYRWPVALVY